MEVNIKKFKGLRGHGTVRNLASGIKIIGEDGQVYEIGSEDVGENVILPPKGKEWKGVAFRLDDAGNRLFGITPWSGSHVLVFKGFAHEKDKPPMWKQQEGGERKTKDGRKFYAQSKLIFTCLLQISDGEYKGAILPLVLDYLFTPESDGTASVFGTPKPVERLSNFLKLAGFDFATDNLMYSDNVLPALETLLIGKDTKFLGIFEEGNIKDITDLPFGFAKPKKKTE